MTTYRAQGSKFKSQYNEKKKKVRKQSWAQWHMPVIPAVKRLRQAIVAVSSVAVTAGFLLCVTQSQ